MRNPEHAELRVWCVEGQKRLGDYVFNANAYPKRVQPLARSAGRRLAVLASHVAAIPPMIERDRIILASRLRDPAIKMPGVPERWARQGMCGLMDGVSYTVALHGTLYSLKSLLDVYTGLMARLIMTKVAQMTFGAAAVNGEELSGGKFIKWLERSVPRSFKDRDELRGTLIAHSRDWITLAISYRDELAHYKDLPGFLDLRVWFSDVPPYFADEDILPPTMPNGTPLAEYATGLLDRALQFLKDTVRLLPNVDSSLVSFGFPSTDDFSGYLLRLEVEDGL